MKISMSHKELLTVTEKELVVKALAGECKIFKTLIKQINTLGVISRGLENYRYVVELNSSHVEDHRLEDAEANIEIEGTLLKIEESSATLYVRIVVINGGLKYLEVSGNFDFRNPFTIKQVIWENKIDGSLKNAVPINHSRLRNCDEAISYIPMYK